MLAGVALHVCKLESRWCDGRSVSMPSKRRHHDEGNARSTHRMTSTKLKDTVLTARPRGASRRPSCHQFFVDDRDFAEYRSCRGVGLVFARRWIDCLGRRGIKPRRCKCANNDWSRALHEDADFYPNHVTLKVRNKPWS
jgi:hypothetical protein